MRRVLARVLVGLAVIALIAASSYFAGAVRNDAEVRKLSRELHADVARRQAASDEVDQDLENRLTKLEPSRVSSSTSPRWPRRWSPPW